MSERREHTPSLETRVTSERMFGYVPDLHEKARELEEARARGDHDGLVELLSNNTVVENLVVQKGEGKYLKLLEWSVEALFNKVTGQTFGKKITGESVQRLVHEVKLSPMTLAELAAAYYHLKKSKEARQLAGALSDEQAGYPLIVQANALNCLASLDFRQNRPAVARTLNQTALEKIKAQVATTPTEKENKAWQEMKIRHGLIVDRAANKTWRDMEDQLNTLVTEREALGDTLHIGRTHLEIAKILLQNKEIDKARLYLDKAQEGLAHVGYENALAEAEKLAADLR